VKTSSRTATPAATWAAEPTSPEVASTTTQGGLEQARGDHDQPQPNRGLELGGDARPRIRPERVDAGGMCAFSSHDDSTSDGVGCTTSTAA
jgi:hypothetical protein